MHRGSSRPGDWTRGVSCIFCGSGEFFTAESPRKPPKLLYPGQMLTAFIITIWKKGWWQCVQDNFSLRIIMRFLIRSLMCSGELPWWLSAYSNSCPSSRWYHPTISSSVVPFSSHLESLPASGSFPVNQFFTSGGRTIGISTSASVLPMNIQDCFSLGWTGWISLQSKGFSRVFSKTTVQKHQFFGTQLYSQSNSPIPTWLLGKP